MTPLRIEVASERAMLALGRSLSRRLRAGMLLFLEGELGAGKTTLVRGLLRGLGYTAHVKSPTYTLVEPYDFTDFVVYHLDLYRLEEPEELEVLGVRDYLSSGDICVVEWSERGAGVLPEPDVKITIEYDADERIVALECYTKLGRYLCGGCEL